MTPYRPGNDTQREAFDLPVPQLTPRTWLDQPQRRRGGTPIPECLRWKRAHSAHADIDEPQPFAVPSALTAPQPAPDTHPCFPDSPGVQAFIETALADLRVHDDPRDYTT